MKDRQPQSHDLMDASWKAFNNAFYSSAPSYDREVGHALLRQATRAKIEELNARSDEQNRLIDMAQGVEVVLPHQKTPGFPRV